MAAGPRRIDQSARAAPPAPASRTRVYKLPQETVDLKFRAKGLLDDVKRNLEEGAEMPDSAEKLRKAHAEGGAVRRLSLAAGVLSCFCGVRASRGGRAPSLPAHQRVDGVEVAPPGRRRRGAPRPRRARESGISPSVCLYNKRLVAATLS